jgi:hypothetical protein
MDDVRVMLARGLLDMACRKFTKLRDVSEKTALQGAIRLRNDIVHVGSSPKDDGVSLEAFIGSTLPFFKSCLSEMYAFALSNGLIKEYGQHLDWARKAFYEAGKRGIADRMPAASALAAFIRWQEMEAAAPANAYTHLLGISEEGYERVASIKLALQRKADNEWAVDCPVCGSPSNMVVDLDGEALDEGRVTGKHAACANCAYSVGGEWGFVVDILAGDQLARQKDHIIKTIVG